MTNAERYKTAKERAEAFLVHYKGYVNNEVYEFAKWLNFEAESEEPLPCPFCGRTCEVVTPYSGSRKLACVTCMCGYHSAVVSKDDVVERHNRVARGVAKAEAANDANA